MTLFQRASATPGEFDAAPALFGRVSPGTPRALRRISLSDALDAYIWASFVAVALVPGAVLLAPVLGVAS